MWVVQTDLDQYAWLLLTKSQHYKSDFYLLTYLYVSDNSKNKMNQRFKKKRNLTKWLLFWGHPVG